MTHHYPNSQAAQVAAIMAKSKPRSRKKVRIRFSELPVGQPFQFADNLAPWPFVSAGCDDIGGRYALATVGWRDKENWLSCSADDFVFPVGRKRSEPPAGPKRTEHAEAVTLMKAVRLHEGKHPELRLLFAVPNGGDRHPAVASKMKAEGVKAGVPDYVLPVARGGFHGLVIELKTATGSASREQKQWLTDLRDQGYRAEVCRGWQQAFDTLMEYLKA